MLSEFLTEERLAQVSEDTKSCGRYPYQICWVLSAWYAPVLQSLPMVQAIGLRSEEECFHVSAFL